MPRRLAAVLVVALAGCPRAPHPLGEPAADVEALALTGAGPGGVDARLELQVSNPNPVPMRLRAIDWELELAGGEPVRGRADRDDAIPARGGGAIAVAIHLDAALVPDLEARLGGGASLYRISGLLHFESARGDVAVPFDEEGDLGDRR